MMTKNWWSRFLVFGVSACVVLLMTACQQPAPPAAVDREAPVTEPAVEEPAAQDEVEEETLVSEGQMDAVDEPVAEPPAMPEPVAQPPATPKPVAKPIKAIWNASFEKWGDLVPSGWRVMDFDTAAGVAVVQCADTPYGSIGLKLVPVDVRSAVNQPFTLPAEYAGKTMKFSAAIKSSEKGMTGINLYYMLDGSRKAVALKDLGTGEWTVDSAVFTLPKNADLESFSIQIGLRDGAEEASCVDDIRLEVVQ